MDARGSLPRVGIPASALPDLAAALERSGPFVTVLAGTDAGGAPAGVGLAGWWREARDRLGAAPAPALAALDDVLVDAHRGGPGVLALADAGGLVSAVGLPEVPATDLATLDPLPRLSPFLVHHQAHPTMLVVLTDRTGADLVLRRAGADEREQVVTAEHDDPLVRRSEPGGWSQQRFQRRAEKQWRSSADEVGERVTEIADREGVRLVVVAGDVRAVQLLQERLHPRVAALVEVVDGGRHAGGAPEEAFAQADRLLATAVASDTVVLAERLREELGQQDQGVTGLEATVAALRLGAVDTLLVHDDPRDDAASLWFGPSPLAVGTAEEVRAMGEEPRAGRCADVLVRAAWGAGRACAPCRPSPSSTRASGPCCGSRCRRRAEGGAHRKRRNVTDVRSTGAAGMPCCHDHRAAPSSTYADRSARSMPCTSRTAPRRRWKRSGHGPPNDAPTTGAPKLGTSRCQPMPAPGG
jgi:hypothetical protein